MLILLLPVLSELLRIFIVASDLVEIIAEALKRGVAQVKFVLNHELDRAAQQNRVVLHNADVDDEVDDLRVDVRWVFSLEDVRDDPLVVLLLWH